MVSIVTAVVVLAQALSGPDSSVVIAGGTRIRAQLDRPVSTRTALANDSIVMSVSHQLLVGASTVLPAGTKLVARLDSITHSSRDRNRLELRMHLVRMIFADGDSIALPQSALATSSDAAWVHREHAHGIPGVVAIAAPLAGAAAGAVNGGARGAVIGGAVGVAAELFIEAFSAGRGHDLVAEKGAPIDLILDAPLVLDRVRVLAAVESAAASSPFTPTTRPMRRCFVAGSPGTPDVTIPGSPPSPGSDGMPENPGSPSIVIPGAPATPDMWVPC
jgi:hypothetical protein